MWRSSGYSYLKRKKHKSHLSAWSKLNPKCNQTEQGTLHPALRLGDICGVFGAALLHLFFQFALPEVSEDIVNRSEEGSEETSVPDPQRQFVFVDSRLPWMNDGIQRVQIERPRYEGERYQAESDTQAQPGQESALVG